MQQSFCSRWIVGDEEWVYWKILFWGCMWLLKCETSDWWVSECRKMEGGDWQVGQWCKICLYYDMQQIEGAFVLGYLAFALSFCFSFKITTKADPQFSSEWQWAFFIHFLSYYRIPFLSPPSLLLTVYIFQCLNF